MTGRICLACLAALVALVALPWTLWPFALFVVAVAVAMVQTLRVRSLRKLAAEAHETATKAVHKAEAFRALAESFAKETKATHAANEILCAELACSDEIIRRLQNDRFATDLAAYDEAVTAPVPFVPTDGPHLRVVPEQRDGAHDSLAALDAEMRQHEWPEIARHIQHDDLTAPMRAVEED